MTRPGIEPQSPGSLANTLLIKSKNSNSLRLVMACSNMASCFIVTEPFLITFLQTKTTRNDEYFFVSRSNKYACHIRYFFIKLYLVNSFKLHIHSPHPICHGYNATQGQLFRGVQLVWIQSSISTWQVAQPRLKNLFCSGKMGLCFSQGH